MNHKPASPDDVKLYIPPEDVIEPAFAESNIPVFFGCDNRFFPHAMAAVASLMAHASPKWNYDILVVQSGIPRSRMAMATEWMKGRSNASLRFIGLGPMIEAASKRSQFIVEEFGIEAFFRVFAPTIFANYDRIAYLESDVTLLADVADFYHQNLGGKVIGACHDYIAECQSLADPEVGNFWRNELGMEPGGDYFYSCGVIMDLEEMRERDIESVLLRRMSAFAGRKFPDRDVFNAVLHGEVKFLGCEWNILDWMFDTREQSRLFNNMTEQAREIVRAACERIKILHYAEKKPWRINYTGKNAAHYWSYAAQTPFFRETLDELRRQCSPWKLAKRRLVLAMQHLNFKMRMATASGADRAKYESRLHNIRQACEGLERQAEMIAGLSEAEGGQ